MGVGIGVLAQPQLVVRFMVVKSRRELNRAVLVGGIFILMMTGVAFTVGNLSNAYFVKHGPLFAGQVAKTINADKGLAVLQLMKKNEAGQWVTLCDEKGVPKTAPVVLARDVPSVQTKGADGKGITVEQGRSISVVYAKGNPDNIIPTYITSAMPKWFEVLFLLTLLSAAMSTLSSQFHTIGTSLGRDVYEQLTGGPSGTDTRRSMHVVRIGMIFGIILAVSIGYRARSDYIIARATAIFFGLCASTFLSAFIGALFFKRMTKAGAIASMITGFLVTAFWLVFVKAAEAKAIGVVQLLTGGKDSILAAFPNWPVVDPLVVAFPLSALVAVGVSLATRPPARPHLARCFDSVDADGRA
jgi:solute:Na+ symporter, SSS family